MSGGAPAAPRLRRKWRPRLGLVVSAMLAAVLALPLAGLFFFRIYENQLVRQTEGELIAQSAALAAVFGRDLEAAAPSDIPLGPAAPARGVSGEPYHQIVPALDLAVDAMLGRRPDALPAREASHPAVLAAGARMAPVLAETQRVTLAGFRLLDARGVVIAGREEAGLSLAHVEEVARALEGHFSGVMRVRISKNEQPPPWSPSRGTGVRVFIAMPAFAHGRVAGVVYASRTPSNVFRHMYEEREKAALAALAILALTLLIGFVFHRAITSPVRELIARTGAIGAGDRGALRPLTRHGTAEFAQLSESFLDMAERLHKRSDFISTFAAHVSHELKSPLTSIQGAAELLRDEIGAAAPAMSDVDRRRFLDNIIADSGSLTAVVQRLRELARAENTPVSGTSGLAAVVEDIRADFPSLSVVARGAPGSVIAMSAENARIVLSHLADNAARHGARSLVIEAGVVDDSLRLVVADDGPGISPKNQAKIFDSFFTTRRDSGGTGMGLSIVRAMLATHGGAIELVEADHGATFALTIPLATQTPGA